MTIYMAADARDFETMANRETGETVALIHDTPCVWTGKLPTLDLAACERLGLYVGRGKYHGGSIVNMPGDLSLCVTTPTKSEIARRIVDAAAEVLSEAGAAVTRDGNDVLADGEKVVSWARARVQNSGKWQSVVHFSAGTMDLDLVRQICTKQMLKIPGSLSRYSITANDCLKVAASVINEYPND